MNLAKGTFEFGWLTTLDVVSLPALVILLPFLGVLVAIVSLVLGFKYYLAQETAVFSGVIL